MSAFGQVRRVALPDTRDSITHKFVMPVEDGFDCYLTAGMYGDGRLGELFVVVGDSRKDRLVHALLDALCMSISVALQYGIPLGFFVGKLKATRFEPAGIVKEAPEGVLGDGRMATSVLDYIFRWLDWKFPDGQLRGGATPERRNE